MDNKDRTRIMDDFINVTFRLLLTTDLVSSGIDIQQVNMVINYDIPNSKEIYIHRIGRCGRFEKKGIAISLININNLFETNSLNNLKNNYEISINQMPDDLEEYLL